MSTIRRSAAVSWFAGIIVLLSGCGGAKGPRDAWRDPNPLPADTMHWDGGEVGVHGGRFVAAQTSAPRTFNALMSNEQSSFDVITLMYASLLDYDYVSGGAAAMLAKSWEQPDSLTWVFHLRRGARFSDGMPLTAADVMFSAEVALDSTLHSATSDGLHVDGEPFEFSSPDSYTVRVKLPKPYALTPWSIASLRIMPKHRLEAAYRAGTFASQYHVSTAPESVVTSGAWKLVQYVPGEKTVFERNPWWFRVDARGARLPYLDQIVYLIVPDQNTAALKFQAGEVDAVDNVKPEDYRGYEDRAKQGGFTLHEVGPSLSSNFIWFNLNTVKEPGKGRKVGAPVVDPVKYAWFNRREFRRAVSKAIDRDAIIRGPYFGLAVKNWATTTPGNKIWHSPDFMGDDYDLEGAKQLMQSIGFVDRNGDGVAEDPQGHPIRFTMKTNGDNEVRKAVANMVHDDLLKIGIETTVVPMQFNALMTNLRQDFDYDSFLLGLGSGVPPDPGLSINVFLSSGLTHFWNIKQKHPETPEEARLDSLAGILGASSDQAVRKSVYAEMVKLMNEQSWFVWLPSQIIKLPVRDRFGNARPQIVPHRVLWNHERMFMRPAGSS